MFGIDQSVLPVLVSLVCLSAVIIIACWVPFYISRLRFEIMQTNQTLAKMLAQIVALSNDVEITAHSAGSATKFCPLCHTTNPISATVCETCRRPLSVV